MVIKMEASTTEKEVVKLNEILTALNMIISKSTQKTLSFYKLLRKETHFGWTQECEQAFTSSKNTLSTSSILFQSAEVKVLFHYLAVSTNAVSDAYHTLLFFLSLFMFQSLFTIIIIVIHHSFI